MSNPNARDNMAEILLKKVESLKVGTSAIIDISVFPHLSEKNMESKVNEKITLYVPDTLVNLIKKSKENKLYYYHMSRLFNNWTKRYIEVIEVENILLGSINENIIIKYITKEDVDESTYEAIYKSTSKKEFDIELSPNINIQGDYLAKILGFALKHNVPILMSNQKTVREAKKNFSVWDLTNNFIEEKQEFFRKILPFFDKTRGVRWCIGITVGTFISPVGIALAIIDP